MKFYERTRRLFPPIFFKFMFSRVLFQLDRKRNKIDYNYGFDRIESENNRSLSKVFDRNPRFPKKEKKNADISFNKLLISEKCEY